MLPPSVSAPAVTTVTPVAAIPAYQGQYQPQQASHAHQKHDVEYNEAATRIVAEEREQRHRLPRYPGLERFRLLDKMGEYDHRPLCLPC